MDITGSAATGRRGRRDAEGRGINPAAGLGLCGMALRHCGQRVMVRLVQPVRAPIRPRCLHRPGGRGPASLRRDCGGDGLGGVTMDDDTQPKAPIQVCLQHGLVPPRILSRVADDAAAAEIARLREEVERLTAAYSFLGLAHARRLIRLYGTKAHAFLGGARSTADLDRQRLGPRPSQIGVVIAVLTLLNPFREYRLG